LGRSATAKKKNYYNYKYGGIFEGNDEDLKYLNKNDKFFASLYFQKPFG
jgi:hypothetical protein